MQKYSKGKFRNVEFHVGDADTKVGRRNVVHEYVQRDQHGTEDLGRKVREFQVECYVIGDDVIAQRDALIAAIETEGPGVLVHPYYGQKTVICESCSIKEAANEIRVIRFSLTFKEAGELVFPKASPDSTFKVNTASSGLKTAASADFQKKFSTAKRAQFVADSAATKIRSAAAAIQKQVRNASGTFKQAADLAFAIQKFSASASALASSPDKLASQLDAAAGLLTKSFGALVGKRSFLAQMGLFGFGKDENPGSTATSNRAAEEQNRVALNDYVKQIAVANAADEAVKIEFTSIGEANEVKNQLLDSIDELAASASDEVYESLVALAASVAQAIPPRDETLPSIIEVETEEPTSSLAIAYRTFGNVEKESDIVSRNKLSHPGMIAKGKKLQVIGE